MDCRGCRYYHNLADNHCLGCDGSGYTRPSNADRIRAMTDEELSQVIYLLRLNALRLEGFEGEIETKEEVLDWLRGEADNGK